MIAGVTGGLAGVDFRAALQRRTRQTMFARDPGASRDLRVRKRSIKMGPAAERATG
jgi:hypothetical protein